MSAQFKAMRSPVVIKVGGGDSINTEGIIRDLACEAVPVIIVLGANAARDRLANELNLPTRTLRSVSGYDSVYSDSNAIDLIMMTYAGVVRSRFVEDCQRHGLNAVGLSGLDARLIQGSRNRGIRTKVNEKTVIKRDYSGKPDQVNCELLNLFLERGITPVLTIPIMDAKGFAINADNDNLITVLHKQMRIARVYQFIEAPGLLSDVNDPSSVIPRVNSSQLADLERAVSGRMKRKLLAIQQLFNAGPTEVVIADGRTQSPYLQAKSGNGTLISDHVTECQ